MTVNSTSSINGIAMYSTETKSATMNDWASLVGRLALAAIFLWSAYGKLAYMDGNIGFMKAYGLPAAWPALMLEFVAGAMLLVGWKARWASLPLIAFTIPATFIFHAYWGVPADQVLNQQIHFMKNFAIVGGLLTVIAHGSGRLSLER